MRNLDNLQRKGPPSSEALLHKAKRAAATEGLSWQAIARRAKQIIVYGSHATAATSSASDLDLLCIGHGQRYKTKSLHIIWIPESRLKSRKWRGSEIATHIAAYGQWIKGENTWAFSSRPNRHSLRLIGNRLEERARALRDYWNLLDPEFKTKHLTRLRRDLQRLSLMQEGQPPVAAGTLDAQWRELGGGMAWSSFLEKEPKLAREINPVLRLARIRATTKHRKARRSC